MIKISVGSQRKQDKNKVKNAKVFITIGSDRFQVSVKTAMKLASDIINEIERISR